MKTKKLTPQNVAPVKRENLATENATVDGKAIAPTYWESGIRIPYPPFAGDDAE